MLSTTTWIIILLGLVLAKHVILLPKQDREIYKLYEQRDKIAMKAMKNELSQETVEYRFVVRNLNFWIYYTKNDYDFSIVWKNITSANKEIIEKIENLDAKIKSSNLLSETMSLTARQSKKALGIRGFIFDKVILGGIMLICYVLILLIRTGSSITNIGKNFSETLSAYLNDSRRIKEEYKEFSSQITYKI